MKDWDSCEVVCALRKGVTSIRRLSIEAGLHPDTLKAATNRKYRRGERIIADALGLKPEDIWPSRYIDIRKDKK